MNVATEMQPNSIMQVDEILGLFNTVVGRFPDEALEAAIEQKEIIIPRLLQILQEVIDDPQLFIDDTERMDFIFALYLLSYFREPSAFPFILKIAALPEDQVEELLGDILTEGLTRFFVSTFNGDLDALKQAVLNPHTNRWARGAMLNSFVGLFAIETLSRQEVVSYFLSLMTDDKLMAEDINFTTSVLHAVVDIYPEEPELIEAIERLYQHDLVDQSSVGKLADIRKWLQRDREKHLEFWVYGRPHSLPIDDVKAAIGWIGRFVPKVEGSKAESREFYDAPYDDDFESSDIPFMYDEPKIGRNDPCPCGSGKKYKKCCLI